MCVRACVVKETLAENIPGITITGEGLVVAEHPKDIAFSRDNDRRPIETGEVATYVDSVIAK
ncbi:hypothetical protein KBC85_02865 [Candidatus Saccharibacteria bacterium]|nr:hypothetical protein [Candidatus Saccharibacteria bacterium]